MLMHAGPDFPPTFFPCYAETRPHRPVTAVVVEPRHQRPHQAFELREHNMQATTRKDAHPSTVLPAAGHSSTSGRAHIQAQTLQYTAVALPKRRRCHFDDLMAATPSQPLRQ